jgi:hypothetical protein
MGLLKLLLTGAVIYAVWFAYKHRAHIAAAHREVMKDKARAAEKSQTPVAQDLVACRKCGAYTPAGTACSCEKA